MNWFRSKKEWLFPVALAGLGNAAGCGKEVSATAVAREPIAKVKLTAVDERSVPSVLTLTGSLVAGRKSDVAADAGGRVTETFVERGAYVAAGAVLARLDARGARLSASEAHAQAEASRAQRSLAKIECDRAERLFAQEAITRAEYDRMHSQCTATEWSTSADAARAALAGKALGDTIVRAPFAGVIAERLTTVGEYIRPGTPVVTLVEVDPLRLELTVPEAHVGAIREGQEVSFTVTAHDKETFTGTIRYIGPAVRKTSRDLVVEAIVSNPDRKLRPGMFALAQVQVAEKKLPVVPVTSLREEGTTARLYAVVNGRLEERVVQMGTRQGDAMPIIVGVRAGERVAARVTPDLRDGLRVE